MRIGHFIFSCRQWLRFWWRASTVYKVQSPQLYALLSTLFKRPGVNPLLQAIEAERRQAARDRSAIRKTDHGAGSRAAAQGEVAVSRLLQTAVSPTYKCRLLYQLAESLGAQNILELGTSLGFSTAYLAAGKSQPRVISLEGDPEIATLAGAMLARLGLDHAEVHTGPFEETLAPVLADRGPFDLIYLDGDHRKEATLRFARQLIPALSGKGVLVIDDLYWSPGMLEAWREICRWPEVRASVDLFVFGLIFIDPAFREAVHLQAVPYWIKPLQAGFFQ